LSQLQRKRGLTLKALFTKRSIKYTILRQLNTLIQKNSHQGDLVVMVNTDVLNRFRTEDSKILMELERSHNGRLIFRADAGMHRERFAIIDASNEKTIFQV
jgi:ribonuclease G